MRYGNFGHIVPKVTISDVVISWITGVKLTEFLQNWLPWQCPLRDCKKRFICHLWSNMYNWWKIVNKYWSSKYWDNLSPTPYEKRTLTQAKHTTHWPGIPGGLNNACIIKLLISKFMTKKVCGCLRLICLVLETAVLCDIFVRNTMYKSSYFLVQNILSDYSPRYNSNK